MTFLYQATILQAKTSTRINSVTIQLNHGPSRDCSVQYGADKKVYIEKTALTLKEKQYIYMEAAGHRLRHILRILQFGSKYRT